MRMRKTFTRDTERGEYRAPRTTPTPSWRVLCEPGGRARRDTLEPRPKPRRYHLTQPPTLRPSFCCTLTSNLLLNATAFSLAFSVRRLALLELCLCLFFLDTFDAVNTGGGAPVLDDTVKAAASEVRPWV